MPEVILQHSVSELIGKITWSINGPSGERNYFLDYIEGVLVVRMFEEMKSHAAETPYSFLELSLAADFARNSLMLELSLKPEEWDDFVRWKFVRTYSPRESSPEWDAYFTNWTSNLIEQLLSVIRGESEVAELLEDQILVGWETFMSTLQGMRE